MFGNGLFYRSHYSIIQIRYSKSALVNIDYLLLLHLVWKPQDFLQHQVRFTQVFRLT